MTAAPTAPFTLLDLAALVRRRFMVTGVVTAVVFAIVAISVMRAEPLYQAQAKLALEVGGKAVEFQDDPEQRAAFDAVMSTQREMLLSRAVAERALRDSGLQSGPRYAGANDPVGLVGQRLKALPVRNAWVMVVTFDDEDPRQAETGLRCVLGSFLAEASQRARDRGTADCTFLEEQLAAADAMLAKARDEERAIRLKGGIVGEDPEASPHARALAELAPRLVDARAKAVAAATLAGEVGTAVAIPEAVARRQALVDIPRIALDPLVERQRARLSELRTEQAALSRSLLPKHPRMIALAEQSTAQGMELDAALAAVAAGVLSERTAAEQQLAALQRVAEDEQRALGQYRETILELKRLAEERHGREVLRDKLSQRLEQRRVELHLEERPMTVVDPPSASSSPQLADRIRGLAVAVVVALSGGLVAALVADLMDRRLRGPAAMAEAFGVPLLATLPGTLPDDLAQDPIQVAEAVRDLRSALRRAHPATDGRAPVMVVAGVGVQGMPVALRTAAAFADAGEAVLLVDADMRILRERSEPGLLQLLAGEPGISPRDAGRTNLQVLASGGAPANPAELLNSHCLPEWLGQARLSYGLIVMVGPDLADSGDAGLVAEHADGVVVVAGEGYTTREQLQAALGRLAGARQRLVGVVALTGLRP